MSKKWTMPDLSPLGLHECLGNGNHSKHILHAELPCADWNQLVRLLRAGLGLVELAREMTADSTLVDIRRTTDLAVEALAILDPQEPATPTRYINAPEKPHGPNCACQQPVHLASLLGHLRDLEDTSPALKLIDLDRRCGLLEKHRIDRAEYDALDLRLQAIERRLDLIGGYIGNIEETKPPAC